MSHRLRSIVAVAFTLLAACGSSSLGRSPGSSPTSTASGSVDDSSSTTTTVAAPWSGTPQPYDQTSSLLPPCCGEHSGRPVSPKQIPAAGTPLLDGDYDIVAFAAADGTASLTLKPFVHCSEVAGCDMSDGDYTVTDESVSYSQTIPLAELRVVLTADPDSGHQVGIGTGQDLVDLMTALDSAYVTVSQRLASGAIIDEVLAELLAANPAGGHFETVTATEDASWIRTQFVDPPAPTLTYDWFDFPLADHAGDSVRFTAVHVAGGMVTLYCYGGNIRPGG